jgi:hypothetical protein
MKTKQNWQKQNPQLPFGDVVLAAYQIWGSGLAAKMLRLAMKERLVVFNGHPHGFASSLKGRSA